MNARTRCLLLGLVGLPFAVLLAGEAEKSPSLGAADFQPTPERPIGWRGDGSGCFPGATPPTTWLRGEKGEKKNILWEAKLPCYSWAGPIVAGDKVFIRSEPYDLICLNKNTGKLLWIRSHPPFIGVTEDEKKANPAFKEIEPLVAKLQQLNDEYVANGWSKALYTQKHDLQKQIDDLTAKADKKYRLPPDMYVESWAGYTPQTPCTDGKHVFIASGDGIIACYDLDGKRIWERYESLAPVWGEHGDACSPVLIGDKLIVKTLELHALDKATGKDLFTFQGKVPWGTYCIHRVDLGGATFVIVGGAIFRVSDGKQVVQRPGDLAGNSVVTNGDMAYFTSGRVGIYKLTPMPGNELSSQPQITDEYSRISMPIAPNPKYKTDSSIVQFYTAFPIYHDGLLYCVSNWGRLSVVDAKATKQANAMVYDTFPPFDLKTPYGRKTPGMGICSSPSLAGKYIYMIDSAGCTVVIEPGRAYKEVAKNNIDETVPEGWEQKYWMGAHHEQTEANLYFEGSRIYIRGEQYLYCVGEK